MAYYVHQFSAFLVVKLLGKLNVKELNLSIHKKSPIIHYPIYLIYIQFPIAYFKPWCQCADSETYQSKPTNSSNG